MAQVQGVIGVFFILFLAFLLSNNRTKINYRTIFWGLGLQLFFAILILLTPIGTPIFDWFDKAIQTLLRFSEEGSKFLFSSFITGSIEGPLVNFAFIALPTVIFFSALMAMFYHYGVMQKVIALISRIMQKTMGTSGAETTSISSNIFVGQTEAPLVVKPFVSKMTKSELMAVMVGGFATVAGGVLALYVSMLGNIEGIAGHLLAASIMSAPAALVIAKIIYPETEKTMSAGEIKMTIEKQDDNGLEALARGSSDGLKLAANIAAMLVAFVAFIALINYLLSLIPIGNEQTLSIELILGYLFMPLAWMMGAPWSESQILGSLMGQKLVLTEMVAYINLSGMGGEISQRTAILASYALCGFANFASIGIQLGGIGSIAPDRRKDLSKLVFKAMLGGALASWLTAAIAGIMISVPEISIPKAFEDYTTKNGNQISFVYNHHISDDDYLKAKTNLNLVNDNGQTLFLTGECIYSNAEKFTDSNKNGIWDEGEEFTDLGNDKWDEGEEFIDLNSNGIWDEDEEFTDLGDDRWNDIKTLDNCTFSEQGKLYNNDLYLIQLEFFSNYWKITSSYKMNNNFEPSTTDGDILFGDKEEK
tara:strand:+ start:321 stop:2093 length:1773 start_codon:yes stop_codon:yes gene_type:complete